MNAILSGPKRLAVLVLAGLAGLVLGTGCSGGSSHRTTYLASATVGAEGGTVTVATGPMSGTSVTIPRGALSQSITVTIRATEGFSRIGYQNVGQAITLEPSGTTFRVPVTVLLPFDPAKLPSGTLPSSVKVLGQDASGNPVSMIPSDLQPASKRVAAETTSFSTLEPAVRLPVAPLPQAPAPLPAVTANAPFEATAWPAFTPLLPPRNNTHNTSTFLWEGYEIDGSRHDNPVIFDSSKTVAGLNYVRRKLTSGASIKINNTDFTVFANIPEMSTTEWAYKNPSVYFLVSGDNQPPTGPINGGAPSTIATRPSGSAYAEKEAVYKITGTGDAHFLPNLPNGRAADGTTLDHGGLTEHVAWTVNPYRFTTYQFDSATPQKFSRGWATPSINAGQHVEWNKLKVDADGNQMPDKKLILYDVAALAVAKRDLLKETVELSTLVSDMDGLLASIQKDYLNPAIQTSPVWLKKGAFLTYQPMPGFQRNLLRDFTPAGTYTMAENTCDLFARADGSVEVPAVIQNLNGTSTATRPYPLVVQTWTDQQFTLLNLLKDPVPSTQDQYPGEEAYYLGNTFLPNSAGVITSWNHYPKMLTNLPDERDSDSWLGLAGDSPWDVMTWNKGDAANDLGKGEEGAQARKPYMFGASVQVNSGSDPRTIWKLRLEHSNSFWWYQVPITDDSLRKNYQATLYLDPGNGYVPVARIWYDWQWWSFTYAELNPHHVVVATDAKGGTTRTDFKYTYVWTAPRSLLGTWVPRFDWLITQADLDKFPTHNGTGGGWVLKPPSTTPEKGSNSPFIWVLNSGAQAGAVAISLIANQADLPESKVKADDLQGMTWNGADMPAYAPLLAQPPAKPTVEIQSNPASGPYPMYRYWDPGFPVLNQPVCRYTLSALTFAPTNANFPRVKFLVVLD